MIHNHISLDDHHVSHYALIDVYFFYNPHIDHHLNQYLLVNISQYNSHICYALIKLEENEAREATATENATSGVATTATAAAEVDGEAVKLAAEAPPAALRMPAPRAREGGCCFLGFGAN